MELFFIISDYTMDKNVGKMNVQRLYIELNYCAFESFPLTLNEVKLLVETVLMSVQVFLALGACLPPAKLPIQPLYTFRLPSRFLAHPI